MDNWQFTPFLGIYTLAAALSLWLSIVVIRMRPIRGIKMFGLLNVSVFIWVTSYIFDIFSTSLELKSIMIRFEYAGMITAISAWLLFVAQYTEHNQWLKKWVLSLVFVIPVFTYLQVLFFPYHNFFYESFGLDTQEGQIIFSKNYGPGFFIWAGYAYLQLITGMVLLAHRIIQMPNKYRRQIVPLSLAIITIIIPNVLYITGSNPIHPYDPTPLAFVIVGSLFLISIFFHRFLDLVPVAYHLVFKNVKSGVLILDNRLNILDINSMGEKILDCNRDDKIGKEIYSAFPEYNERFSEIIKEYFRRKRKLQLDSNGKTFELTIDPLKDYKGKTTGSIIMLHDITEQTEALDELNAFGHMVAHDLKNPLGQIKGYSELIEQDYLDEDEKENAYNGIRSSVQKMNDIIEGLLLLARIRNQESLEMKVVDMDVIVENAYSRLEYSIISRNAKVTRSKKWPKVLGHDVWVEEIWVNYLSNALKYGGSPPEIELGFDDGNKFATFWVKDNGSGLKDSEIANLFAEFSRLKKHTRNVKGHGLGLSIVERIVKRLGGRAGVESVLGEGSKFYFTLPLAQKN